MKKTVFLFLFFTLSLFGSELILEKSFQESINKSQTLQKPIMFIVSRHSCKYCVLLERDSLSKPQVIEKLNKDFVVYIAYTDDGDEFPQEFWRPATPAIWFLNDNKEAMSEPILGAIDDKNLLEVLEIIKNKFDEEKYIQQYNYTKSKL